MKPGFLHVLQYWGILDHRSKAVGKGAHLWETLQSAVEIAIVNENPSEKTHVIVNVRMIAVMTKLPPTVTVPMKCSHLPHQDTTATKLPQWTVRFTLLKILITSASLQTEPTPTVSNQECSINNTKLISTHQGITFAIILWMSLPTWVDKKKHVLTSHFKMVAWDLQSHQNFFYQESTYDMMCHRVKRVSQHVNNAVASLLVPRELAAQPVVNLDTTKDAGADHATVSATTRRHTKSTQFKFNCTKTAIKWILLPHINGSGDSTIVN